MRLIREGINASENEVRSAVGTAAAFERLVDQQLGEHLDGLAPLRILQRRQTWRRDLQIRASAQSPRGQTEERWYREVGAGAPTEHSDAGQLACGQPRLYQRQPSCLCRHRRLMVGRPMSGEPISAVATAQASSPTGSYSQATVAQGVVYFSAQVPLSPEGGLVLDSFEAQMRQCFANLQAVADAAGTSLRRAVRIGVFLSPRADADEYNRIYAELIDWSPPPARTTVRSDFSSFDIEIDAICLLP